MTSIKNILKSLTRISLALFFCITIIGLIIARPVKTKSHINHQITVNKSLLRKHVIAISEQYSPRSFEDIKNLNGLAEYIKSNLSEYSQEVSFQEFKVDNQIYKNVIAKFGPKSDSLIVIGAHYDAMSKFAGADDNASGVAGLIELARLLSQAELKSQVELVAYTLEEPPYFASEQMGSYIHAESIKDKKVKIMISLEMIGYFTDEVDS